MDMQDISRRPSPPREDASDQQVPVARLGVRLRAKHRPSSTPGHALQRRDTVEEALVLGPHVVADESVIIVELHAFRPPAELVPHELVSDTRLLEVGFQWRAAELRCKARIWLGPYVCHTFDPIGVQQADELIECHTRMPDAENVVPVWIQLGWLHAATSQSSAPPSVRLSYHVLDNDVI